MASAIMGACTAEDGRRCGCYACERERQIDAGRMHAMARARGFRERLAVARETNRQLAEIA